MFCELRFWKRPLLSLVGLLFVAAAFPAQATIPATGVVISEVFYSGATDEEWVELYNPTASDVVIDDWTLDDGDNEGELKIVTTHPGPNYGIAPGGFVVIAQKSSSFQSNHCFVPDFAMIVGASSAAGVEPTRTQAFLLSNTDDQVILRNATTTIEDAMGWGCQKASSSSSCGTDSNALLDPLLKRSSTNTNYYGAIRTDPTLEGAQPSGELSEVLPLAGLDAQNGSSSGGLWTRSRITTRSLVAGSYVSNCDPDTSLYAHAGPSTGGLIRYPYIGSLTLGSAAAGTGSVEIVVQGEAFQPGATVSFSGTGILVRQTQWVSSQAIRLVVDLRPSAAPGLRDVSVTQPNGFGTSSVGLFTVNTHQVVPATTVVISELMAAPAAGGTAGEWLELHNPTSTFVVLDGWTLFDGVSTLRFPDTVAGQDDLIFVPGGSVVITRAGDSFATATGLQPDFAITPGASSAHTLLESGGSFELLDANGGVVLRDGVGRLVDAVGWGTPPAAMNLTHPLPYGPSPGVSLLRVERKDSGGEAGGPLNEQFVEAFETSDLLPTAQVTNLGEGPEVGGLQAIPIVASVTPSSAEQGSSGVVITILGQNFDLAASVLISDTGITQTNFSFVSANELQLTVDISPMAPVSLRDVTVVNPGNYRGGLSGGFRVTLPIPTVVSVSPNSVFQGDASVVLDITGQNTHFSAGDSQLLLGDGTGYAVQSIAILDLTHLQATVTFLLNAAPGFWDVRVSTAASSESATGVGLLELRPLPRVEQVTPGQGNQGQSLGVTITGVYTDFTLATPTVDFGLDIAVSAVTVIDATTLTASLDIGPFATLGLRAVTVTTGAQAAPSAVPVFEVLPRPAVSTVTPASAFQGDTLYVTLEGINTSFGPSSVADFGAGINVLGLTVNGPRSAVVQIAIDSAATVGTRDVQLTTGVEQAILPAGFEVIGRPRVTSVIPGTVQQGATGVGLDLVGVFTSWDNTTSVAFSDLGLSITGLTVNSPTSLHLIVDVGAGAPLGLRDLLVTTGTQVALATGGLRVTALSYVSAVSPPRGTQGQTLTVEVTGANTGFVDGVSSADFGTGITVQTVSVSGAGRLIADLIIDPAATVGPRDVVITTGSQVALGSALFNVDPLPFLLGASPAEGLQGTRLFVDLVGTNTHFDAGSFANFGAGIAVVNLSVSDATHLQAELAIASDAVLGPRDPVVYTGAEIASGLSLFSVLPAPSIVLVDPASASTGDSLQVSITGANTNFVDGTTTLSFGGGIGVTSVQVTSPTTLVADLVVSGKAAPGLRDLSVSTGGELVIALDAFEVLLRPRLVRITPSSAVQGELVVLEIEGQGTSFVDGAVSVDLGPGIVVSSLSVAGTLRFVAQASIALDATPGTRDLQVTSGADTLVLSAAFTVNALSRVQTVTPATARREESVEVTLEGVNTSWGSGSGAVFGDGVTVGSFNCASATQCTTTLTVDPLARLGTRDVTVITGGASAVGFGLFEVLPKAMIDAVFPDHGPTGATLVVTAVVSGALISALDGAFDFGPGVTVDSVALSTDLRSATLNLSLASDATPGPRAVKITTTDAGVLSLPDGFRVDGRASLLSALPDKIPQGESVQIVLLGDRSSFDSARSIVDFGEGTVVAELEVLSPEEIRVRVRASPDAVLGLRDVTVTTGTEIAVGAGLVEIVAPGSAGGDTSTGKGGCSCSSESGLPDPSLALAFFLLLGALGPRSWRTQLRRPGPAQKG